MSLSKKQAQDIRRVQVELFSKKRGERIEMRALKVSLSKEK